MAAKSLQFFFSGLLVVTYATLAAADVCDTSQLMPCLPAAKTNPQAPTGQCCNLIHALTSECLCAALQSTLAKLEGIDFNIALQLPHKCGRIVPKGTKCGDTTVPNAIEHGVGHHEAMEHGMEHHENQERMESETHSEESQQEMQNEMMNGMEHSKEPQMENGMEH